MEYEVRTTDGGRVFRELSDAYDCYDLEESATLVKVYTVYGVITEERIEEK